MGLGESDRPLCKVHDLGMIDLDGVVYVGAAAVPGAAEALGRAREAGLRLAYLTNNASRTSADVATHLRELGIDADDHDVVTAAQAVAHLVADAVPPGSPVLVIGGEGLRAPLRDRGLRCVDTLDDGPVAVVQGFHPDVGWRALAEASYAIASGLPWFASNTDLTVPTARGIAPGNGSLVQTVQNATGATPVVAGKPARPLFDETLERTGASRPVMVGDRLDTDIDGAIEAGLDSLVVLSGVSSVHDVAALPPERRPTYVGWNLTALVSTHTPVVVDDIAARCGSSVAVVDRGTVALEEGDPASLESLRAVTELAWTARDRSGDSLSVSGTLDR